MKRIICIAGDAVSGKSTAAQRVRAMLGEPWHVESTGARFREYCALRGLDPQEISAFSDADHRGADAHMYQLLAEGNCLIAEARLVGYLARNMPDALRVFCDCPLEVRAQRLVGRESERGLDEARMRISERDAADTAKFLRLYGIDFHDPAYYTHRVDTAELNPEQVAAEIVRAAGAKL